MEETVMKKILFIALAALMAFACNKLQSEAELETPSDAPIGQIAFNITVNHPNPGTKATKTGWESGDKVYVFFNNVAVADTPKYAILTYDGTNWTSAFSVGWDGTGLAESGATMTAVYFPFAGDGISVAKKGSSYTFKYYDPFVSQYASNKYHIYTYYLTAENCAYTLATAGDLTTLSGTLNMELPDNFVQFYVAKNGEKYNSDGKYRLAVQKVKPVACAKYSTDGTSSTLLQKEKDYGQPLPGYKYGDGVLFSGIIDPTAWGTASERRVLLFDTEAAALTKTFTKTLESHDAVILPASGWDRAVEEPTKIHMGQDGAYWADRNLGATSIDGYGFYFAWAEIVPWSADPTWQFKEIHATGIWDKTYYAWWDTYDKESVRYGTSMVTWSTLDDPATAFLGPDWHTSTNTEQSNLKNKTWTSVWEYPVAAGNACRKVTGGTGTLYLPAAGYHQDALKYAGTDGEYTSNYTGGSTDYGYRIALLWTSESSAPAVDYNGSTTRYLGLSVRPVSNVAPKSLASVTTDDLGKVIGLDGKIYDNTASATSFGTTAVAMICYVGSETEEDAPYNHGLAMALGNCGTGSSTYQWKTSNTSAGHSVSPYNTAKGGLQYRDATHNTADYPAFQAAFSNNGTATPANCSDWFLATDTQYARMMTTLANAVGTGYWHQFESAFESRGGTNMGGLAYWTSTETNDTKARKFCGGYWTSEAKTTSSYSVRSSLAF